MRAVLVHTNPRGVLAVLIHPAGRRPVVHLNAELVTEAQAAELERRIAADPDVLVALGLAA